VIIHGFSGFELSKIMLTKIIGFLFTYSPIFFSGTAREESRLLQTPTESGSIPMSRTLRNEGLPTF
jgi:hypothetical protein